MSLKFRWILPEEFPRLEEIFDRENWAIPNPEMASILIGENEQGEIKACNVVQSIVHIGPAWIAEEYRHQGIWRQPMEELKNDLNGLVYGVMLVAMSPATEKIAQFLGMKKSEGVLYLKDFQDGGD